MIPRRPLDPDREWELGVLVFNHLVKYENPVKNEAERAEEMKLDGGHAALSQRLTSVEARRSLR